MSDELEVLIPEREIEINGEKIVVAPFKFGQLPFVFKKLETIGGQMFAIFDRDSIGADQVLKLLGEGGDDLIELVARGCKKDREWFDTLEMDEGIQVTAAVIEANASFFIEKVLPQLNQMMEEFNKKKDQVGLE